ncbi:MAG: hypothetical protein JWM80_4493, partial [Cyanobacteria bacterium RYN_339]|nr:hypothetical protein [Cyanobacteria bacterium RYN_339]
MAESRTPEEERQRVEVLHGLQLLDTPKEERFDRITRLARRVFDVPIAAVSLVDVDRTWFKSCVGLEDLEVPRTLSFCDHAIRQDGSLIIPDTQLDARFVDHPLGLRFYAGRPLTAHGRRIGTLCLMDYVPREFGPEDRASLYDVARLVEAELDTVNLAEAWLTAAESRD